MPVPLGGQHNPPGLLQQMAQTMIAQLQQVQNQLQPMAYCDPQTASDLDLASRAIQEAIAALGAYTHDITRCAGQTSSFGPPGGGPGGPVGGGQFHSGGGGPIHGLGGMH